MKLVEQTVSVRFACLGYIFISCQYAAVGIGGTPIKFQLFFQIGFVTIEQICQVTVSLIGAGAAIHQLIHYIFRAVGECVCRA